MDRKVCVLIYSQYSPASKRLIEYISSLPYDIIQLTGITLLAADCELTRNRLEAMGVLTVPCLRIEYFDGTSMMLENDNVYKFIESVTKAINTRVPSAQQPINLQHARVEDTPQNFDNSIVDATIKGVTKNDEKPIMAAALDMQKSREADMIIVAPKRTPL